MPDIEPSGIFSQSNYGIVTKMGMTLMPNPGGYESFVRETFRPHCAGLSLQVDKMYTFPNEEDLEALVSNPSNLVRNRTCT